MKKREGFFSKWIISDKYMNSLKVYEASLLDLFGLTFER